MGHEQTANHTLHVRTIAGTDWEWAFGAPVLSANQDQWWGGTRFAQLYNQGQAREVTREKLVFDWISGVRMERLLLADEKLFSGLAAVGAQWKAGARLVRVAGIDAVAGTVDIEVVEGNKIVFRKTLGPVRKDLLVEDSGARKALVFEYGDLAGFLSPWPEAVDGGKANLKIYAGAYSLRYGADYAPDPRFAVYPVGCPSGHNFGFMLVNKHEIRLAPGTTASGPDGYFRIAVDQAEGDRVLAWHIEDQAGGRSRNLGGADVHNVDLVLGQGRVAGQAILKDVGKAMLERMSGDSSPPQASIPVERGSAGGVAMGALALLGISFEMGRRRPRGT